MATNSEVVVKVKWMEQGDLAATASVAAREFAKIQKATQSIADPKMQQVIQAQATLAKASGEQQLTYARQRIALLERYGSITAQQYAQQREMAAVEGRESLVRGKAAVAFDVSPRGEQLAREDIIRREQMQAMVGESEVRASQRQAEFDTSPRGDLYAQEEVVRKAAMNRMATEAAARASGRQADYLGSDKGQAGLVKQESAQRLQGMAMIRQELSLLDARRKYLADPRNKTAIAEEVRLRKELAAKQKDAGYTEQYGGMAGLAKGRDAATAFGAGISEVNRQFLIMTAGGVAALSTLDAPWASLTASSKLLAGEFALNLIPAAMDVAQWFTDAREWVRGWDDDTKNLVSTTAKWSAVIMAGGYGLQFLAGAARPALSIVMLLGKGFISTTAAIYASITADKAKVASLNTVAAAGEKAKASMGGGFGVAGPLMFVTAMAAAISAVGSAYEKASVSADNAATNIEKAIKKTAEMKDALDKLKSTNPTEQQQGLLGGLSADLRAKLQAAQGNPQQQLQILQQAAMHASMANQWAQAQTTASLEQKLANFSPTGFNVQNSLVGWLPGVGGATMAETSQNQLMSMGIVPTPEIVAAFQQAIRDGFTDEAKKTLIDVIQSQGGQISAQSDVIQQALQNFQQTGQLPANLFGNKEGPPISTGHRSAQMDVFAMREMVQQNVVRDDAAQRNFVLQMQALQKQLEALEKIAANTNQAGGGGNSAFASGVAALIAGGLS